MPPPPPVDRDPAAAELSPATLRRLVEEARELRRLAAEVAARSAALNRKCDALIARSRRARQRASACPAHARTWAARHGN